MEQLNESLVKEYYNKIWSEKVNNQQNNRHRYIFKKLRKLGLLKNSKVLEVGAGSGLTSQLIFNYLGENGYFLGVDISDESIKNLNKRFRKANIEFQVNDMISFSSNIIFDFIVFPDVLEHIPIVQHNYIFKSLRENVHASSIILINNPHPEVLAWYQKNNQDQLQIIDVPLYPSHFMELAKIIDFEVFEIIPYKLYHKTDDYQWIVMRKNIEHSIVHENGLVRRLCNSINSRL
jgi:trans-aconitate 2-methyltransferase